jgi:asparagine synthase (glutamine-hydrolysing)
MCGILGHYNIINQNFNFNNALSKLNHRGPDDFGIEVIPVLNSKLYFGHKRLSIIDLTKAGHQPMYSSSGRFLIVFNGEIYNYKELRAEVENKYNIKFKTNTDTEVLLECWEIWGKATISKLNGMFAFVIFDREKMQLSMYRDAFGIKPLYYHLDNHSFTFSSEISPILLLQNKQNRSNHNVVYEYIVNGKYESNEETFFENIFKLMPGCFINFDIYNFKIIEKGKWINFIIQEDKSLTFKDATEKVRELFLKNIKLQLRSDVPIGAALSGGIDSSAVVCAIRYLEPKMPINTFTFISLGDKNEEVWADKINNYTNAISNKISVNPSELFNDLDDLITIQGEPFMSSSIYAQYRVFKLAKEKEIIVTLDGQGADELLAGYNGYAEYRIKTLIESGKFNDAIYFIKYWANSPNRSYNDIMKRLISLYLPSNLKQFAVNLSIRKLSSNCINNHLLRKSNVNFISEPIFKYRNLSYKLRNELTNGGLQSLLRHGDRNSMRWSIESRVPFLENDFAQLLLSLPENYLVSNEGLSKNIFRRSMEGIVPKEVLYRRDKIGFETPELRWLLNSKKQIHKITDDLKDFQIFNSKFCSNLINETLNGNYKYDNVIWRIINYVKWSKINSICND